MKEIITDLSVSHGKISLLVRTDTHNAALRFSLCYTLQPHGYPNSVGHIEIVPMLPRENTKSVCALFTPNQDIISAIERVMYYFQYVKTHLHERKNNPLSFALWNKTQIKT